MKAVSRTLLIPLAGRAVAARMYPGMGFADPVAQEWCGRLGEDLSVFENDRASVWGTIHRTLAFDGIAREFLAAHPEATVLNLGGGLCTRFYRVDTGRVRWIDVDLPEVIELKRGLRKPGERGELVTLDLDRDALPAVTGPVLVLAEGLLMFLQPGTVERIFGAVAGLGGPARMAFDFLHPLILKRRALQPLSFRATGATYVWSTRELPALVARYPKLRLVTDRALSSRFGAGLRLVDRVVRFVAGGPLYDIAVVEL